MKKKTNKKPQTNKHVIDIWLSQIYAGTFEVWCMLFPEVKSAGHEIKAHLYVISI